MVLQVMLTDIVAGPWKDLENGPLAPLQGLETNVQIVQGKVPVWNLEPVQHFEADLVGQFGLRPNVLSTEICTGLCNVGEIFAPSCKDRRDVQRPQKDVFDDPMEMLSAAASAIMRLATMSRAALITSKSFSMSAFRFS